MCHFVNDRRRETASEKKGGKEPDENLQPN